MTRCYSRLAQVGLLVISAALVLDCAALALDIVLGRRIVGGQEIAEASLQRSSQLSSAANLAVPAAVLVGGLIFLWWFQCAYRRMDAADATQHTPPWAVFSWFVPVLNLFRPPKMMIELSSRVSITWAWWGLWGVGAVIQAALRLISPATQQGWVYWQMTAFVANLLLLASLALAYVLISTVSELARARNQYWRPEIRRADQRPKLTPQLSEPAGRQPQQEQQWAPFPQDQWSAPQREQEMQSVTRPAQQGLSGQLPNSDH